MESLLQTKAWAKFKEQFGWKISQTHGLIGMERSLPMSKSLLYFPEIPLGGEAFQTIAEVLSSPQQGRIFSRFEFLELWSQDGASQLIKLGLVKSFEDVQPEYRQWIDLAQSEDKILEAMKPKGRYNIKVALRHNLTIDKGIDQASVVQMFELYSQTAKRTHFSGRDVSYFEKLASVLKDNDSGEIILIKKDGHVLAGVLLSFYGGVCSYLYGGSSNEYRELMAPYLAHWEAIKLAKKKGCQIYDLLAVAPTDKEFHPHAGLTRFKTQFGGQTVRLLGSWDLVHQPFWYSLYRLAEKHRRKAIR